MIIDVRIYDQWWITCIYIFYITYIWHITYIEIQYIYIHIQKWQMLHAWYMCICLQSCMIHHILRLSTSWENPPLHGVPAPPCRRRNTSREKISAAASCWWACSSSPWPAGDKTGAPGGSTNAERIRIDDGKKIRRHGNSMGFPTLSLCNTGGMGMFGTDDGEMKRDPKAESWPRHISTLCTDEASELSHVLVETIVPHESKWTI